MSNNFTALVPMKGISERVPDKNIRTLNQKPACHWVLESLSSSDYINEIIVNTDSEKIKDIVSIFEKVKVLDRADYLLGNEISIQPLIEHDLGFSRNEFILQTHSTNPLLTTKTIDLAIESYLQNISTHDSLMSVTPIKQRFYFQDGKAINHDPRKLIQTQLLEPIYHENSCMYIFSKQLNRALGSRIGSNPFFFEMNPFEATDIDEWHDFHWAEYLLKNRNNLFAEHI